jgi:CheY-like chemotaxis protein
MTDSSPPELVDSNQYHILVADDDEIGRRAVSRVLERAGYACVEAISGTEARQFLEAGGIDLLLADIKMEGNTRLELLEYLSHLIPRVPAVLMTGHPTVQTAAAATSFAVSAYLLKPLDPQELLKVVQKEHAHKNMVRRLQLHRQRQEDLLEHMRQFEAALDQPNRGAASDLVHSYASLAFESALDSLIDVKVLFKAALNQSGSELTAHFSQSRPAVLMGAIQEAINVIDRTKHSFKSRELAALRQKLESVLREKDPNITFN